MILVAVAHERKRKKTCNNFYSLGSEAKQNLILVKEKILSTLIS